MTYRARLHSQLTEIYASTKAVVAESSTRWINAPRNLGPGQFAIQSWYDYVWQPDHGDVAAARATALSELTVWHGLARPAVCFSGTPQQLVAFDGSFARVRLWLARDQGDATVPRTTPEALAKTDEKFRKLWSTVLDVVGEGAAERTLFVPDTNWIIHFPSFVSYVALADELPLEIHLAPLVLSELDALKVRAAPDVRLRVRAVVRAIDEISTRGRLDRGVPICDEASLHCDAGEPQREGLPASLDLAEPDDRLIATALLLQARNPRSDVWILTDDLNLRNKATSHGFPHIRPPEAWTAEPAP